MLKKTKCKVGHCCYNNLLSESESTSDRQDIIDCVCAACIVLTVLLTVYIIYTVVYVFDSRSN